MSLEEKKVDLCVYIKYLPSGKLFIQLYMNDMLIVSQDNKVIYKLNKELSKFFDIKALGQAKQILGIEIICDVSCKGLWMS